MKLAICDDDRNDLAQLHEYCARFDPAMPVRCFLTGEALMDAFQTEFFDLVLLDIELPGADGLTVGKALTERAPAPLIVFTTQSLSYAVRGYGIALRYLPKPIDYDTFSHVMRLASEMLQPQSIPVSTGEGLVILSVRDITMLEVEQRHVLFRMQDHTAHRVRSTLTSARALLPPKAFGQPHQGYLVNLEHVERVFQQTVFMDNGTQAPVSRNRLNDFQEQLFSYLKDGGRL